MVAIQALKTEGKTDEDIYAELKTMYNNAAMPAAAAAGDIDKPTKPLPAEGAAADPSAESRPAAGDETEAVPVVGLAEGVAADTPVTPAGEGEAAAALAVEK